MPNFFFHLHNDVDAPDPLGTELPDLAAAQAHAVEMARFEASEAIKHKGRLVLSHRIDIEDEGGEVLATVHFGEVVSVRP